MRNILISLRKSRKLTQEEVARAVGISRAFYARIESAERNPSLAIAMNIKQFFKYFNDDIFFNQSCDKVAN